MKLGPITISRRTGLWIFTWCCRLVRLAAEVGEAWARDRMDNPKPEDPDDKED